MNKHFKRFLDATGKFLVWAIPIFIFLIFAYYPNVRYLTQKIPPEVNEAKTIYSDIEFGLSVDETVETAEEKFDVECVLSTVPNTSVSGLDCKGLGTPKPLINFNFDENEELAEVKITYSDVKCTPNYSLYRKSKDIEYFTEAFGEAENIKPNGRVCAYLFYPDEDTVIGFSTLSADPVVDSAWDRLTYDWGFFYDRICVVVCRRDYFDEMYPYKNYSEIFGISEN